MIFDEIDDKVLKENFDEELINQLDVYNVEKIFNYLFDNGVYYAKDLFLSSLDLFLYSYDEFSEKFENLKERLGNDYVDKLAEDSSLIEIMYE